MQIVNKKIVYLLRNGAPVNVCKFHIFFLKDLLPFKNVIFHDQALFVSDFIRWGFYRKHVRYSSSLLYFTFFKWTFCELMQSVPKDFIYASNKLTHFISLFIVHCLTNDKPKFHIFYLLAEIFSDSSLKWNKVYEIWMSH